MQRRGRHFRVGLLVLGAGALFLAMIVFTLGASVQRQKLTYYIRFDENVKGMVVGSKVNFQGVPAGVVTDIRFADGQSLVEIEVGADQCVVQPVTRARLDRLLVTGQVTIELEGYERDKPRQPSGSMIEPAQNPMGELAKSLPNMLDSVPVVLRQLDALLGKLNGLFDVRNTEHVAAVLANVDAATARLPALLDSLQGTAALVQSELPKMREAVDATLAEVRAGARDARGVLAGESTRQVLANLAQASSQLAGLERDAQAFLGEARSLLAGSRGAWLDALGGVRDTMRDVRALARLLQLAPSSLIYGRRSDDAAAPPPGGER